MPDLTDTLGPYYATRHRQICKLLLTDLNEHLGECMKRGMTDKRLVFEAWALQKLAGLWLTLEESLRPVGEARRLDSPFKLFRHTAKVSRKRRSRPVASSRK
jgi:hypothetical protein